MAPTLIASYNLVTSAVDSSTLTTPSFTPSNGEIIVVKAATWDSTQTMGTPTGGSQTYTSRAAATSGGFRPWVGVWTATVSGSPGSMTISSTPSASSWHNMVVERWSGASLAATPVAVATQGAPGAAASSLTTSAANSVISWLAGDAQSVNPSTRAYLASASEELVDDQHASTNGVWYYAQQAVASAGSTSFGLSAPTGMQWWIAGVEVLNAGGSTTNGTATVAGAGSVSTSAAQGVTATTSGAGSTSAAVTQRPVATLAGAGTTSAGVTQQATATIAGTGSAAATVTVRTSASPGGAGTVSTAATQSVTAIAIGAGTVAANAGGTVTGTASVAGAGTVGATATQPATSTTAGLGSVAATVTTRATAAATGAGSTAAAVRQLVTGSVTGTGSVVALVSGVVQGTASVLGAGVVTASANGRITPRPNTGTTARPGSGTTARPFAGITVRP